MSCLISVTYTKPKDQLIAKLKEAIKKVNGKFEGNESLGSAEADTPIGKFRASYSITGDNISINVEQKPFFISCKRIQDEVEKYLKEHPEGESLRSDSLERFMILPSRESRVIWEKQFQKEVCVNIPIVGRKCVSITASVKLTEEDQTYFVEIELLGQRIKHQLLDVCYDVFTVAIASIKVCTRNVAFENDRLKSLTMTVEGCIDTQIVGIPIKECWTLLQQDVKFFELTDLSIASEFMPKSEARQSFFIGIGSAEAAEAEEEVLSKAYCHFITYDGGNDKDDNSKIQLSYKLKYGASGVKRIIADAPMESHGRFPDGDDRNVDLLVKGRVTLSEILNNAGEFTIDFEPNGDDTWKFHYELNLVFSSGTTIQAKAGRDKELSDHGRSMTE